MDSISFFRKEEKYMKRVLKILSAALLSATVAASAAASVSAAGINAAEQKILDELRTTATMNGIEKTLPATYINQAENYFNTVDITDAEATEIINKIEDTKKWLTETQATNFEDFTDAQEATFIQKCQDIAAVVELKMTYEKSTQTVTITDTESKTVFTASNVGANVNPNNDRKNNSGNNGNNGNSNPVVDPNPIKNTGLDFNIPGVMSVAGVGILLVSAAGVYLIGTKKKAAVSENV